MIPPTIKPNINNTIHMISIIKNFFTEYRRIKACFTQALSRKSATKGFLSLFPHLHYQRKLTQAICGFYTLETYKQRISDSFLPSELVPASRIRYKVLSNYRHLIGGLIDTPALPISP